MKISTCYKQKKTVISLEVFPPKQGKGPEEIIDTIGQLQPLEPDFVSVTYSAGGSGESGVTFDLASLIKNTYGIEALAHLTCIHSDPAEVGRYLEKLKAENVENILALRGDIPPDFEGGSPAHYRYAKELIRDIKKHGEFCVGAAAYPEGHLSADSVEESLGHLREKVDEGADFLITQLFFDNRAFHAFHEKARKAGIQIPISAGIMPILGRSQIQRMIFMCGVSLPAQIIRILSRYENDPASLLQAGIEYSGLQIRELMEQGVDGIHIYTMNRPQIARENIATIKAFL